MLKTEPDHIIAIGASAGGMEEINIFFDHTPLDGVAYVIVQHLSADFKSRMVELLSRHSKLVVKEARNAMLIRSNEVYLIPNDKFMTVKESRLYLTDKIKGEGPHLTINTFFNSLAADNGRKAIGVILSGLGSDGTEGIRSLKASGGLIIVRDPATTEFSSMPSNAIATGLVDLVLQPASMPDAIEEYVQHEKELHEDLEKDEKHIVEIIELIKEYSPLDFSDYKKNTILRRTKRRAAYNSLSTILEYLHFLKTHPEEVEALVKDFLISVTSFFRDKDAFEIIKESVLPKMLEKHRPGEDLKLWVAGCATGEEVYSLAILLCEALGSEYNDVVIKIFATDIDNEALTYAGKGVYPVSIEKDVSPDRLEKYFLKEGDNYKVRPEIRRNVIFAQHDIVKNPPYCNMDLISCRNLLIYMTPILQKKIFDMLLFGSKVGGYLFLGSSENPAPILGELEVVDKKWRIYQKKRSKRKVSFETFHLPELSEIKKTNALTRETIAKNSNQTLAEAINNELANKIGYVALCVDEEHQVIRSYGNTSKYLLQENFNTNLPDLLPGPINLAYNTLAAGVAKDQQRTSVSGITFDHNGATLTVELSISPLIIKKGDPTLFIITLREDTLTKASSIDTRAFDPEAFKGNYINHLEEELKEIKTKLAAAYELLDASNENLQSFNEELISANEEMQSTNEEMQSVNEELHTINADHLSKNKELLELNDDLNNYFRSNINGQLFVDNDLLIMKFSPGTLKLINLLDSDVGRPIMNVSTNIKFDTIIKDIQQVIAEGDIISKEVEANNGRWYQVMTMPYLRLADNERNGAIISFSDITDLKKAQLEVDKKNASLMRINADLDNFAHATSHDLLGPLNNIELSINTINRKITDPEMQRFLTIINSSVKKFSTMIKEIGTVARIENDRLASEMVDLDELLNNIEWSLENKIELSGAVIIRDLAVKTIWFSKKNLRSILYNLVSNAIKFRSDSSPHILITSTLDHDEVLLTVEDNGKGIPENGIKKIFDMYGRLNENIEGSGIGLYLANKIINAAGGRISVESQLGKGSKFTLRFKLDQ